MLYGFYGDCVQISVSWEGAEWIREEEVWFTVNIGISENKLLAKDGFRL